MMLAEPGTSLKSLTQTVRVDIRKLDHLMNIVGELAIVRGALSRIGERLRGEGERKLATELQRLHRTFERRLGEMQAGILAAPQRLADVAVAGVLCVQPHPTPSVPQPKTGASPPVPLHAASLRQK
mgnify:CR=1 FL=1